MKLFGWLFSPWVKFFLNGITEGFRIGYRQQPKPLQSAKRGLSCTLEHPETVKNYLAEEISAGRVAGPFSKLLVPNAHVSRFGGNTLESPTE